MIKNFQELISQIKSQVPIHELISEYATVKKSGRGYVALCPFHDDHHPSLQIHPQKGIFKCFSCGTGGDLITFYALINKKKWAEAIPELALKYGLKVEYGNENKAETQIKNQLYELNREALEFFKGNLHLESSKEVLEYLTNTRKLLKSTIEKYEIGFAQNNWDSLLKYLAKEKKYPQELIIASGLFVAKENQEGYYDRFRNRVIFPIYNETSNVIGFGGRILSLGELGERGGEKEAKYINSPETLVFNKGNILYGLNFAKEYISKLDYVILTEGYLDVISAHQSGLLNTVATLGTALSLQQIRLLTKFTDSKKVCICLDSDQAGFRAVESIFRLIQDVNQAIPLDLRVTSDLPKKDLDESLSFESAETLAEKIKNGEKLNHFILNKFSKEYLDSTTDIDKKSILEQIIDLIIAMKDPLEQKDNIKYLSQKLNIDEEIVNLKSKERIRFKKQRNRRFQKQYGKNEKEEDDTFKMHSDERFKHAELELLTLYISSFPNAHEIKRDLSEINFIDEKHVLIKEFIETIEIKEETKPQDIIDKLILAFNEYKHIMSVISDLAWRIDSEDNNYSKNKDKILSEAKEWIRWWVTNKQKMKSLTEKLKDCKNGSEESEVLREMVKLIRSKE